MIRVLIDRSETIEQILSRRDHFVTLAERNKWGNQRLTSGNPLDNNPYKYLQQVILMRTLRDHSTILVSSTSGVGWPD
jgi:hypothetical protein